MPIIILVLLFFLRIIYPDPIYAETIPQLTYPLNGATTSDTSPLLCWTYDLACEASSCYKAEVSNNEQFSQPKTSRTKNTHYSPQNLSDGKWYWRVSAKDEKGDYTLQSEPRSFIITSQSQDTNNPTNCTDTTAVNASPSSTKQSFIISLDKNELTDSVSLPITVRLENFDPNKTYYLKGAFYKDGSTNYFGLTNVSGTWIKNSASYNSQFKISTNSSGNWQDKIDLRNDPSDSGFTGSGEYKLKMGHYTEEGKNLTWSNSVDISLHAEKPFSEDEENTPSSATTPGPSATASPKATISSTPNTSLRTSESSESSTQFQLPNLSSDVLGAATESSETSNLVAGDKSFNWWFVASGITLLIATGTYLAYQRKNR